MPSDEAFHPPSSGGIHAPHVGRDLTFSALGDIVGGNKTININTTIQISIEVVTRRPLLTVSPYRSLDPFKDIHKDLFFGRDQLIKNLLIQLSKSNVLLVLGASGSGKSSVVRAGLLPELNKSVHSFRYFTLVPDANPFISLCNSFQSAGFSQSETSQITEIRSEKTFEILRALQNEGDQWLIFVDQFEEIFTRSNEHFRKNFLEGLLTLAQAPTKSIKLVLAMRADFLDHFGPFPQFAKLIEKNINFVAEMHADELRLAIEQPAARHGVVFESGLVEEIIKDVQGQIGSLPLLQYTLDLLWKEESLQNKLAERHLKTKTYRELGGVRGALQKRADEIYDSVGDNTDSKKTTPNQETVRNVFLRLVDITGVSLDDPVWRPVRRRAPKSSFTTESEQNLLNLLINEKLIVSNWQDEVATVEIAHEALFASWPKLKNWIEGAKEVLFVKNRLADDAFRWRQRKEYDPDGAEEELLVGSRLSQAMEMQTRGDFAAITGGLTERDTCFLVASAARKERRAEEERIRQQRELERERLLRTTETARATEERQHARDQKQAKWILAVIASIATIVAIIAVYLFRNGESKTRIAESRRLATLSDSVRQKFPQRSLLLAVESVQTTRMANEPVVAEAQQALFDSLYQMLGRALTNSEGLAGADISDDGWLATATTNGFIQLQNIVDKNSVRPSIDLPDLASKKINVIFSADSKTLVLGNDDEIDLWHAPWLNNKPMHIPLTDWDAKNLCFAVSSDARRIFIGGSYGAALLLTIGTNSSHSVGLINLPGHLSHLRQASFSPNGHWLATSDGKLLLWDLTNPDYPKSFKLTNYKFDTALAFSKDGRRLISTGLAATNQTWLWSFGDDGSIEETNCVNNESLVASAAFSDDGNWLATGHYDNTIRLWQLPLPTNSQPTRILVGHQGVVTSLAFLDPLPTLASGSDDASIRFWNPMANESPTISNQDAWRGHEGTVSNLRYCARAHSLFSRCYGEDFRVSSMLSCDPLCVPMILNTHKQGVAGAEFDFDHKLLYTAGKDGLNKMWTLTPSNFCDPPLTCALWFDEMFKELSSDGKWMTSWSTNGTLTLWQQDWTKETASIRMTLTNAYIRFSPDGRWGAANTWDDSRKNRRELVYDLKRSDSPKLSFLTPWSSNEIEGAVFSPDGLYFVTCGMPPRLFAFDGRAGWRFRENLPEVEIFRPEFSSNGRRIIFSGRNNELNVLPLDRSGRIDNSHILKKKLRDVVFESATSPNGRWLVAVTLNHTCYLFDMNHWNEKEPAILDTGETSISSAAFSPDGQLLLTVGLDKRITLWDFKAGTLSDIRKTSVKLPPSFQEGGWVTACFTSDSKSVAAIDGSGQLAIWPVDIDNLSRIAAEIVGRNLSRREWAQYFPSRDYTPIFPKLPIPASN